MTRGSLRRCLLLLALPALASGCRRPSAPPPHPPVAPPAANAIADDLGRPWEGAPPARRVVSLAPNVTEIVCALGAHNHLVGVDTASDYPPEAADIPRVGQFLAPNVERIVALRPDVVFLSSATIGRSEAAEAQARFRAPVFVLNPRRLPDVAANVRVIGRVLGMDARAEEVAEEMERRFAAVTKAVAGRPRRSVFLEVWHEPITTVGPNTVLNDLIELAGGRNVAAAQPKEFPTFSLEALLGTDPDVYIITQMAPGVQPGGGPASRPGFKSLRAVREGRARPVPADPVLRPTPRLGAGAEAMARAIHPEAFGGAPQ